MPVEKGRLGFERLRRFREIKPVPKGMRQGVENHQAGVYAGRAFQLIERQSCSPPRIDSSTAPLVLVFAVRRLGFRRQFHELLQELRVLTDKQTVRNKGLDRRDGTAVH